MSYSAGAPFSRTQTTMLWLLRIAAAGLLAWIVWGWVNFAGPYRWAADLQLGWWGHYDEKLSVLLPLLGLMLAWGIVGRLFGVSDRLLGPARPRAAASQLTGPALIADSQRRSARLVIWLGLAFVAGGALAAGYGYLPHAQPSLAALDITVHGQPPPQTDLVAFTGVAHRELTSVMIRKHNSIETRTAYTPITSQDWRPGQPITYFREQPGGATSVMLGGKLGDILHLPMASLSRNDLPGLLREDYRKDGIVLDDPYYVVSAYDPERAAQDPLIYGVIAAFMGVMLMLAGAAIALLARRAARRAARPT